MSGNGYIQDLLGFIWDFSLIELYNFALGSGEGFADLIGCERPINCRCARCVLSSRGADDASEGGKLEEWLS